MYFKRLEMHGFKSFADPVVIEFHEGITCVVGPNGSGKSNISDAIRWVLGEQSPKTLRGGKMEEVIFAGSTNRKLRGMAEVTLVIDNSTNILDIDYAEVSITRRMFRSGESEYLINNVPCRLRDIRDLIMDTGIGVDGYSIIGQGKIADIVSNKPESRREIFEEAAGIVAYKTRKAKAERRLEATGANLLRAEDIIGEIEGRIDGLREDSVKAKEYLDLRSRYESLEVNIILRNMESMTEKNQVMEEDAFQLQTKLNQAAASRDEAERNLAKAEVEIREIDDRSSNANRELLTTIDQINNLTNSAKLKNERREFLLKEERRLKEELGEIGLRLEAEKASLEKVADECRSGRLKLETVDFDLEGKNSGLAVLEEESSSILNAINRKKEEIISINSELINRRGEAASMETMGSTLENRFMEINVARDNAKSLSDKLSLSLSQVRSKLETDERSMENLSEDVRNQQFRRKELKQTIEDLERKLSEISVSESRLVARKKTIEEMEANYEGYNHGVRFIMKSHLEGIKGVVGESMLVPEGLEVAIETALGGAMQHVICRGDQDAKKAINLLKQNSAGRLTFLPISSVKGSVSGNAKEIAGEAGYIGAASELINFNEEYRGIFNNLLGRVVIVENMDSALALSKKSRSNLRFVTIDGDVINATGSITGGRYRNKSANLLSRKAEIHKLKNEIGLMAEERISEEKDLQKRLVALRSLEEGIEDGLSQLKALEVDVSTAKAEIALISESYDKSLEDFTRFEKQLHNLHEDKNNSSNILADLTATIEQAATKMKALEAELEELLDSEEIIKEKLREAKEEKVGLSIEKMGISTNLNALNERVSSLKAGIAALENSISVKEGNLKATEVSLSELDTDEVDGTENLALLQEKRKGLDEEIAGINRKRDDMANCLSNSTKILGEIGDSIEKLQNQKHQLEVKVAKNQAQMEHITQRLWDEFNMSPAQAADKKDADFNMASALKLARETRKRLRDIGDVNVGAIKEYEELSKRYDFLIKQRQDITEAMDELKSIIADMSNTIKSKFKESFDKVVVNFETIFTELFGGGTARLTLEDEDDPLSSGIDIVAQPPGKKLQNINLMSGGEKTMTAIALMFAVLKAKPTPFCILDEVEAALDDSNIDRFSEYLKKFEKIQFVLVTHQKATMEHADVLYGVTMAEQGVSRLLSLKLGDETGL